MPLATSEVLPQLSLAITAAREVWPGIELPPALFAEFLKDRSVNLSEITSAQVQDLYLACACAARARGAIEAFNERYASVIVRTVRPFDPSPAFADEVRQRLNEALFVEGIDSEAKIGLYTGNGPLLGFVRTAVRRIAGRLVLSNPASKFVGEEALAQQFADHPDNETTLMKERYKDSFNRALIIALRRLGPRERFILKMNLINRVSTGKIALIYNVSQPTLWRWMQRAARKMYATVKELVCDELDVDTHELHSLLALVRSQIELTMSQTADIAGLNGHQPSQISR